MKSERRGQRAITRQNAERLVNEAGGNETALPIPRIYPPPPRTPASFQPITFKWLMKTDAPDTCRVEGPAGRGLRRVCAGSAPGLRRVCAGFAPGWTDRWRWRSNQLAIKTENQ